jgi:hypothetical protein
MFVYHSYLLILGKFISFETFRVLAFFRRRSTNSLRNVFEKMRHMKKNIVGFPHDKKSEIALSILK